MDEQPDEVRPPGNGRSKVIAIIVVAVVLLLTLVLCCVAVSQLGKLFDIDPRLV